MRLFRTVYYLERLNAWKAANLRAKIADRDDGDDH